jgi:hypothetical protein
MSELPGVVIQPVLQMSAGTAAKIASGQAYIIGGVVREVGSGRLVELLSDVPDLGRAAQDAARSAASGRLSKIDLSNLSAPKLNAKVAIAAGSVLLVTGAAVGGYQWVAKRRKQLAPLDANQTPVKIVDESVADPTCLTDFRASLEAYVEAGRSGSLSAEIIGQLVADLDAVQDYADGGNAIVFTLEEMLPFFELVTAHTPVLAAAYGVEVDEVDDDDVVVTLRKNLETQKLILSAAA